MSTAIHAARRSASATVALIAGPELPTIMADVARWRPLTPSARRAPVGLTEVDRTAIVHRLGRLAGQTGLRPRQLILLGTGETGRRTLEAVLQGALDYAGILAVDIPCGSLSVRVSPIAAAIRLVVHHDDLQPPEESLVRQLQHADIDVRIIGLGTGAGSGSTAVARASVGGAKTMAIRSPQFVIPSIAISTGSKPLLSTAAASRKKRFGPTAHVHDARLRTISQVTNSARK